MGGNADLVTTVNVPRGALLPGTSAAKDAAVRRRNGASPIEGEVYSVDDFRVPASDAKGHYERIWFRLSPGHARQLEIILGCKKWPYRTEGDIIRHAIVSHMHRLEEMEDIPSVLAHVDAAAEIMREDEYYADFENTFNRLDISIGKHRASGRLTHAINLLRKVAKSMSTMEDGEWKMRYMKELEKRGKELIEEFSIDDLIEEE